MTEPKKCEECKKTNCFVPISNKPGYYICLHCKNVQKGD